jgi:hypothetical protein
MYFMYTTCSWHALLNVLVRYSCKLLSYSSLKSYWLATTRCRLRKHCVAGDNSTHCTTQQLLRSIAWAMHLQLCSISDIQQQYTATHKRCDVTNPKQLTPRYAKAAVGVSVSENHVLSGCHDCTCTYAILLCRRRFIVVNWFESSFELMTAEHVISTF